MASNDAEEEEEAEAATTAAREGPSTAMPEAKAAAAGVEEEEKATTAPGWSYCCHFRELLMRSGKTLTRGLWAVDYEYMATRYGACAKCLRGFAGSEARCGNPYGEHRHGNFRRMVQLVEGKLADARKYPAFKRCRYVCAYCVNRARRERINRRGDRRIIELSRAKIKTSLKHMGLSQENVKKGIIQIMTKPRISLTRTQMKHRHSEGRNQ